MATLKTQLLKAIRPRDTAFFSITGKTKVGQLYRDSHQQLFEVQKTGALVNLTRGPRKQRPRRIPLKRKVN